MNHETPLAQGPVVVRVASALPNIYDNPPKPCAEKCALGECIDEMLHGAWIARMLELAKEYRAADDGRDVRDAWRALQEHIGVLPASLELTVPELRAGIALQLREIERLRGAIEAMRAAGGRQEFQVVFDAAKAEAAGHRLALELECLLLDTKDLPTVSRWWESGMKALEEWQRLFPYNGPRLGD